ncbi:MAG: putative DNA binding domain-containing protein [Clostridia bacterium]|nr:putative DNA binding domain-containing protein [Clostridia bacterium]
MLFESESVGYKPRITEEVYKDVIAFANSGGGTLYFGVDRDGNETGLSDAQNQLARLTDGIRDAILPDVTPFVECKVQENKVIKLSVGEGTDKPYYLTAKGIRPGGVFVRRGTESAQADPEQINRMIRESGGESYEEQRSLEQALTFASAKDFFGRCGVGFGEELYDAYGLSRRGAYTNLGLILSDQCPHTTKIAVFSDEELTVFRDCREFGGSVCRQFEDAVGYLTLCNRTASTIRGVIRTDRRDYPEEAIREALLNAFVHRDYGFSGSNIINVSESKMEFISLGGLPPGLSTEDVRLGISQPRNRKLTDLFRRLHLIETYGTGIRRVFKLYERCASPPEIAATRSAFKIVLPNMNAAPELTDESPGRLTDQMKTVLDYLETNGQITDEELESLLGVKKTRVFNLTKEMKERGLIESIGRGRDKRFLPCKTRFR